MTLKECYAAFGGDYEAVTGRLRGEERVAKFLRMFLQDDSYAQLTAAMDGGDDATAFRMAHTLKGVCQNLALTRLYESSAELTEALRGGERHGNVPGLWDKVQSDYRETVTVVEQLD